MAFALAQKPKRSVPLQAKRRRTKEQPAGLGYVEQTQGTGNVGCGWHSPISAKVPVIQPKLKIGDPNDKYEKEADRVADEVMRMPDPTATSARPADTGLSNSSEQPGNGIAIERMCTDCAMDEQDKLQRKRVVNTPAPPRISALNGPVAACFPLADHPSIIQRMEMSAEDSDDDMLQMKSEGHGSAISTVSPGVEVGVNSVKSGGQPLSESTRAFFEPRFGVDFSEVRVHVDGPAAQAAHSVQAKAFTTGPDIAFGAGEYAPESEKGRRLLGHELAHVVQQSHGDPPGLQRQFSSTNYRFDTYKIAASDLSDPDIIARFNWLSYTQLLDYRDRVADQSVATYIDNLIATRFATSFEIAAGIDFAGAPIKLKVSGINVTILPDTYSEDAKLAGKAETPFKFPYSVPFDSSGGNITSFRVRRKFIIQTVYGAGTTRRGQSGYGRGTTPDDIASGKTSLAHHEGSHVLDLIQFLEDHPPPRFTGKKGMTEAQFRSHVGKFGKRMAEYVEKMRRQTKLATDCVGAKASFCDKVEAEAAK